MAVPAWGVFLPACSGPPPAKDDTNPGTTGTLPDATGTVPTDDTLGPPEIAAACLFHKQCPGAVFFLPGPLALATIDVETESDWMTSTYSNGGFGEHLAAGSDLNGDGVPDLAIGDTSAVATYIIFAGGN